MKQLTIPFVLFLVLLSACGVQRQYESYPMTITDLTITTQNHPHGYGKSECFTCHLPSNIHNVDRIGAPSFAIAKTLVEQQGLNSCTGCHGTNGVP